MKVYVNGKQVYKNEDHLECYSLAMILYGTIEAEAMVISYNHLHIKEVQEALYGVGEPMEIRVTDNDVLIWELIKNK